MRITLATQYQNTLSSVNRHKEQMYSLSEAIASEVRFSDPSDDPTAWAKSMDLKQGIREYQSILGNIDFASGWNEATDSALNNVSDNISQARQVAISAIGADGVDQSGALVQELDSILEEMVNAANSQYGDQYVFAGTNTGTAPYSIDDDGNVTYDGNTELIQVKTNRNGGTTTVNTTGTDVFEFESGGETLNILQEIWELKDAVSTGDTATISAKLDILDDAAASVSGRSTATGTKLNSLEDKKSSIKLIQTDMTSWLSDTQDTDLTEAITRYSQVSLAYQAALQVTGMVDDLSLVNFI